MSATATTTTTPMTTAHINDNPATLTPGIAGSKTRSKTRWAGRVISALAILFLLFDSAGKLMKLAPVVEGTVQLGYPTGVIIPLGIILLACVVIYMIPRTAILGAILLTGYLGGAIATHVRVGNPLFSHILFPIYFAALVWGGLFLRDDRVRALLAPRRRG